MHCPSCRRAHPAEASFCLHCGTRLPRVCPQCQSVLLPEARFCMRCGQALVAVSSPLSPPAFASTQPIEPQERGADQAPWWVAPLAGSSGHEAERRQLTVLFCDLVGSTALAGQLDPEDWREVVRAYQTACAEVIGRFEGHIAQYLGDGLLVYFGYPQAHEDNARRAVRAGLGMVAAMDTLRLRLVQEWGIRLAVRLGIHTGLVVVGSMGGGDRQEQLALGEVPHIAARLQGLAAPDTVVLSAATYRLVQGFVACDDLGAQTLRGLAAPMRLYRVLGESGAQSRLDAAVRRGLTPLVGREADIALLLERWAQAQHGQGQIVILNGEAGIGKSRLVQELQARVEHEEATRLVFRCLPEHQQSALYPVIEHLQRLLQVHREDTLEAKLDKLEHVLLGYGLPLHEMTPLFAALLSLPVPAHYPPLHLSPERHKQQTQAALIAWLLAEAERRPVLVVWEELHWADPSTLEFLGLFLEQAPAARMLTLLTYRPEFHPPWAPRPHYTQLTVSRLTRPQVEAMVGRVTGGKRLPAAVVEQIVAKTDGVPLFVEELTKMVLESGLVREAEGGYVLSGPLPPLAIPATLQDSLMARLDRLLTAKGIAQLGAVLGRQFSFELLQAVAQLDEAILQRELHQLVEAEFLQQHGSPPQATYMFKHVLIQEAAYQSLLKRTRQQYHQRIGQILATRFAETVEAQPELLAHHSTEAGLMESAIIYWQLAGERAMQRSAHVEAVMHLTRGLAVLQTLPDTPQRAQQELRLQTVLGPALIATKGYAASEVERTYARARELCQQSGATPGLFSALRGLWVFNEARAEHQTARQLGAQLLTLAQTLQDPMLLVEAHRALGNTLFWLGEFASARTHLAQGMALYDPQQHHSLAFLYGTDPGVVCLSYTAWALGLLGYADQALQKSEEALALAQQMSHFHSLALALTWAIYLHQARGELQAVQERVETLVALAAQQRFPYWLALGTILEGWTLSQQRPAAGIAQMQQGLAAYRATGAELFRTYWLALLAEAYGTAGHVQEGLQVLDEALALVDKNGERYWEAELYRRKGELLLQSRDRDAAPGAAVCLQQALAVARRQQAKALELRAALSLSRLWHQQSKRAEAYRLVAEVYGWFTEGFATADLQEARVLLDKLPGEGGW
jgi:class 3 adenylate cyclase/predicted ATPase